MTTICTITRKIGMFVLLLAVMMIPVTSSMAAEPGAQGNPGPGGATILTEAQLAALAAASLVGFALVANTLTEDDSNATASHHTSDLED
jgi:hypothetical protein